ncbi:hypothetical protein CsatB_002417 [Cannabis sativa]
MAELPISYQPCPTLDKINPKTTVTGYPVRKKSSSTTTDPELLTCSKWLIVLFFLCLLLSTVYVCYLLFILSSSNPEISVISSSVATVVAYNVSTNYYLVDDLKVGFQAKNLAKKDMVYKNISLFVYHRHKKFSGSVMLTPTLFEEKSGENKTIWTTLRMRLPIDDWIGSKSDNKSSTRDDDYVVVGVLDLEFSFQGWIMNKGWSKQETKLVVTNCGETTIQFVNKTTSLVEFHRNPCNYVDISEWSFSSFELGMLLFFLMSEEMEHLGLRPNMYTFNICIRALERGGKIDEAFGVLKKVEEDRGMIYRLRGMKLIPSTHYLLV